MADTECCMRACATNVLRSLHDLVRRTASDPATVSLRQYYTHFGFSSEPSAANPNGPGCGSLLVHTHRCARIPVRLIILHDAVSTLLTILVHTLVQRSTFNACPMEAAAGTM
jgi:hypothetical protein